MADLYKRFASDNYKHIMLYNYKQTVLTTYKLIMLCSYKPFVLGALPTWKVHTLTGDREGTWSLTVTRNRRLTFGIDGTEREIYDVDLEDYH